MWRDSAQIHQIVTFLFIAIINLNLLGRLRVLNEIKNNVNTLPPLPESPHVIISRFAEFCLLILYGRRYLLAFLVEPG